MRHCLTFWEDHIELPHVKYIALAEATPIPLRQVVRQAVEQSAAVFGTLVAILLILYNMLADVPVGLDQHIVDSHGQLFTCIGKQCSDVAYQLAVALIISCDDCHRFFRTRRTSGFSGRG